MNSDGVKSGGSCRTYLTRGHGKRRAMSVRHGRSRAIGQSLSERDPDEVSRCLIGSLPRSHGLVAIRGRIRATKINVSSATPDETSRALSRENRKRTSVSKVSLSVP